MQSYLNSFYSNNILKLRAQHDRKEIDDVKYKELWDKEEARAAEEFAKEMRTDALMVRGELQKRIPKERRKHMVGLPDINPADPRAGSVSLYSITTGVVSLAQSERLAYEIEELVKLLPDK